MFAEGLTIDLVQLHSRLEIIAKGLLNDNTANRRRLARSILFALLIEPHRSQVLGDDTIERWWSGEIIDIVPWVIDAPIKYLELLTELRVVFGRSRIHREIIYRRKELLGKRSIVLSFAEIALKRFIEVLSISYIGVFCAPKSEDRIATGELILLEKLVKRRDELTLSQVARAAKDYEDEALGQMMLHCLWHIRIGAMHCRWSKMYHSLGLSSFRGRIHHEYDPCARRCGHRNSHAEPAQGMQGGGVWSVR